MTTRRRGSGEGGLRREERSRTTKAGKTVTVGYWQATVEVDRDSATGKRRRVCIRAETKAEALAKVAQARQRFDAGVRDQPGLTVERFLTDWVELVLTPESGGARRPITSRPFACTSYVEPANMWRAGGLSPVGAGCGLARV